MTKKTMFALIAALIAVVVVGVLLNQYVLAEQDVTDNRGSSGPAFDIVTSFSERLSNDSYHFEVTIRNSGNEGGQADFLCTLIYQNGDRDSDMFHMYVNAEEERTMDVYIPYVDDPSHWAIETECTLR